VGDWRGVGYGITEVGPFNKGQFQGVVVDVNEDLYPPGTWESLTIGPIYLWPSNGVGNCASQINERVSTRNFSCAAVASETLIPGARNDELVKLSATAAILSCDNAYNRCIDDVIVYVGELRISNEYMIDIEDESIRQVEYCTADYHQCVRKQECDYGVRTVNC
jgi:hypothetical protein